MSSIKLLYQFFLYSFSIAHTVDDNLLLVLYVAIINCHKVIIHFIYLHKYLQLNHAENQKYFHYQFFIEYLLETKTLNLYC